MATSPMFIQTQVGTDLPPHGMHGPHNNNMHRSSSHGHQGQAQRQAQDRHFTTSPMGNPARISGRRIPLENNRALVRRHRSISLPSEDNAPASYSARHRQPVHVEYHDLRDDDVSRISEVDARKQLTSYIAVRLQKRQTSDEHDHLGRAVQESWKDAVHYFVPGMAKEDILAQIGSLNRQEGVAERKQNMSELIQAQLEKAYHSLKRRDHDHRFDYTLAQIDKKSRKVEKYELDHDEYTQARNLDKRQRGSSSKRKSKGSKSSFEHSKPSTRKFKQTVSVTAYFKREPKAQTNCRQLLRELAMRGDRGEMYEVDELDDEDDYGEDSFDDDGQSEESSPRAPVHMPHHEGMQSRPMPVPPHHPVHPPQPQYAQHGPPPPFPQQQFDNAGPNGPMHPGGHQQNIHGGPPPGPPAGFGPQPHMQHPGPHQGPPPPPPPPQRGPPNMGLPGGRPMGPPGGHPMGPPEGHPMGLPGGRPMDQARGHPMGQDGGHPMRPPEGHDMGPSRGPPMDQARGHPMGPPRGPSNEDQGGFPGRPPPSRHEPRPEEAGGRPLNHQGHSTSLPHQPPLFRGPSGGADSSRSSSPGLVDRGSWSGEEDDSTGPSSIGSTLGRYAPYKPSGFDIHGEQRRSSPRPYLEDEGGPFTRRPQERPSQSPPRQPSQGSAGLDRERRSRERNPPPSFAKETRGHDHTRRSRRDDGVSDVEEQLGRMRFGGDDRRDRDRHGRQDHGRRRSPVRSRNRGEHSRPPRYRHRDHSPSHEGYERRSLRRSDDHRERYHRRPEGGGRDESHRRDRADSYEPRYGNVSSGRPGHSRHRDDAYHHHRR